MILAQSRPRISFSIPRPRRYTENKPEFPVRGRVKTAARRTYPDSGVRTKSAKSQLWLDSALRAFSFWFCYNSSRNQLQSGINPEKKRRRSLFLSLSWINWAFPRGYTWSDGVYSTGNLLPLLLFYLRDVPKRKLRHFDISR